MFSSDSRYRRSTVVTSVNRAGQPIKAVELRIPPPTVGKFLHPIEEGERIDSLAHKYYRQAQKWWRIADANPDFPTPDQLLGQSPLVTERIALTPPAPAAGAPWARALAGAAALVGVSRLLREQDHRLLVETHTVLGNPVEVVTEQTDESIVVTYNQLDLDPATLLAVFVGLGFTVAGRERISRVGQAIVVPPDGVR